MLNSNKKLLENLLTISKHYNFAHVNKKQELNKL